MKIRIQEAWWGAWKSFGWAKGIWGVGFKAEDVEEAIKKKEKIEVKIYKFDETFEVSPVTVKNYATKNNTIYEARGDTLLYVIPQTKLDSKDASYDKVKGFKPSKKYLKEKKKVKKSENPLGI